MKYVMRLAWSASTCHCQTCSNQASSLGFLIRGLYMDKTYCGSISNKEILQFYNNLDQPTKDKISEYWNPLAGNQAEFIADEYQKYGSCYDSGESHLLKSLLIGRGQDLGALKVSDAEKQFDDYVMKSIGIYDQYKLFEHLKKKGIEPSIDLVSAARFQIALDTISKRGAYYITCVNDEKTGQAYLDEIRLCLDSEFNPTTCNNSDIYLPRVISNCPQYIYYLPNHKKRVMLLQES